MNLSFIFTFAPVPLTSERSPLAHAAALVRKRQSENVVPAIPRHRISPPSASKAAVVHEHLVA